MKVRVLRRPSGWHWWCPCCMGGDFETASLGGGWQSAYASILAAALDHVRWHQQRDLPEPCISGPLTTAELRALDLTVQLVNLVAAEVIADGPTHGQDVGEFVHYVHGIQHMLMSQAASRAYPDQFRLLGGTV